MENKWSDSEGVENKMCTIDMVNNILSLWQELCNDFLGKQQTILEAVREYSEEKNNIIEKYQLNINEHFNIFTAIAEKYKYENLHSDLLKVILGNEKNEIGKPEAFNLFLKCIGISEDDIEKYFGNYDSLIFKREYITLTNNNEDKGFIDLLIYNEEACIIIENKVNGASDQPNQLGKYYEQMIVNDKKKFVKIVYLTINESSGPSNFSEYTDHYKRYIGDIKSLLINLPCVASGETKKFIDFLGEILAKVGYNEVEKTFIDQYKSLLESIGGKVLLMKPEQELIKNLMKSKEQMDNVKTILDIWNRRLEIVGKSLPKDSDCLIHKMCKKKIKGYDVYVEPNIGNVGVYYYDDSGIQIGFCANNGRDIDSNKQKQFGDAIIKFKTRFSISKVIKNEGWVWTNVTDIGELKYDEVRDEVNNWIEYLEAQLKAPTQNGQSKADS